MATQSRLLELKKFKNEDGETCFLVCTESGGLFSGAVVLDGEVIERVSGPDEVAFALVMNAFPGAELEDLSDEDRIEIRDSAKKQSAWNAATGNRAARRAAKAQKRRAR